MATEYMSGEQLLDTVSETSSAVAGANTVTVMAGLGGALYATPSGGLYSYPINITIGGDAISDVNSYASELWTYYKTAAQAGITSIGAAAAGAATWAQGVLFGNPELAGTLAGSGGLLTMSLPAAAAAFVPLLGVSIGGAIYESNPELLTKISQAILPWAYDDKNTMAFVVDELGQVFAPKGALDALARLFADEKIGKEYGNIDISHTSATGYLSPYSAPVGVSVLTKDTSHGTQYIKVWGSGNVVCTFTPYRNIYASSASDCTCGRRWGNPNPNVQQRLNSSYTLNGKTVYYASTSGNSEYVYYKAASTIAGIPDREIAWYSVYGSKEGSFPTGTSAWTGDSVDVSQLTPVHVVSGANGSTTPYIPITLPVGDPTVTNDPAIQPDPTASVAPGQLDPYISPVTLPELWPTPPEDTPAIEPGAKVGPQVATDPLYVPVPDLNPAINPSIPVATETGELTVNQQTAQSGGTSPSPIFPVPGIQFPSWTPAGSSEPVVSGQPGFIQIYHPSPSEFVTFGRWLWVTYADSTIDKIWNNPFDGVIGAHELYATPEDGGYSTIRCGFLDSGVSTQVVNQRYTQINCGSIVIPEYWGNYLDYSPYSQAMIYLPFIGIVNLEVDDIVGAAVNVLYHVDSYTGSCIAQITVAKDDYSNTLYQFSGNCSVEIPMAGGSQAQIKAALMTANAYQNAANISANLTGLGGLGSGIASALGGLLSGGAIASTGNFAGGMASGIGGAASGVSQIIHGYTGAKSQQAYGEAQHTANMLSGKAIVQHSGSFGSSHGAMGIKKPYIIIRRPIQKVVNGYQELYGYPAHKQVIIGSCQGYLRCREVHVVSSLATDAEKNQIESLLKGGVYVTESVN